MKRAVHLTEEAAADLRELDELGYKIQNDYRVARTALATGVELVGFDLHPLQGELAGWYAFAIGVQTEVSAPRVVYYEKGADLYIIAAGEHDSAYSKAKLRRAEMAGKPSRRADKRRKVK